MNIYSLPAVISFTVNFSIAFIVLMEKPKVALNRWFAAFILSFAVWNLAEILILNSADFLHALLGAQILYRVLFLAPAFYVIIAYLFPRNFSSFATNPFFDVAVFSLPILFLSLSFPDFQIELISISQDPRIYHYHFSFNPEPCSLMLLAISISYVVWGNVVLANKIKHLRTIRLKNQTRFFVLGMNIIFAGFIAVVLLKARLSRPASFYFLHTVFTFIIAAFFFIAVVKFHLFKPGKILTGGATYTVLSAFTLAVYFLVIRAASAGLESWIGYNSVVLDAALILALVFLIVPFQKRLQSLFDRILNKDLDRYRRNILELFRELQAYRERRDLLELVRAFIIRNLGAPTVYVFDHSSDSRCFVEIQRQDDVPCIPESASIVQELRRRKGAVEFYDLSHGDLDRECRHFFETNHARFLLPLMHADNIMAIVVICRRKHGVEFTETEGEILSILGSEIAASLHRNRIIEEMRENDRRRFQVEKLAAIGQLTASVAHEIRNPLNTISTSAETLLQENVSAENQEELKRFIIEESHRVNRILGDFLNLARIRPAVNSEINMEDMFERLRLELENSDALEIPVSCEIHGHRRTLVSDPDLLFQALLNLGLNARAAIEERCRNDNDFTCDQGIVKCVMRSENDDCTLSVTDNGVGIPPQAAESIYDPFFSTKTTGTGLGLSIVHQIIEVLSGTIEFTSRPGYTSFRIRLLKQTAS